MAIRSVCCRDRNMSLRRYSEGLESIRVFLNENGIDVLEQDLYNIADHIYFEKKRKDPDGHIGKTTYVTNVLKGEVLEFIELNTKIMYPVPCRLIVNRFALDLDLLEDVIKIRKGLQEAMLDMLFTDIVEFWMKYSDTRSANWLVVPDENELGDILQREIPAARE